MAGLAQVLAGLDWRQCLLSACSGFDSMRTHCFQVRLRGIPNSREKHMIKQELEVDENMGMAHS